MAETNQIPYRNHLLSRLSSTDLALLLPHMHKVELQEREQLEFANHTLEYVYFLEDGVSSVVSILNGQEIEVGLAGCEGMSGYTALLGANRTPNNVFMQVAGSGWRIQLKRFLAAAGQSTQISLNVRQFAYTMLVQAQATAHANGRGKLEDRLARWLLMVHDRIEGNSVQLTHEFLSVMLGVRRPGVTVALHILEGKGVIRSLRREIIIEDRDGLLEVASESYGLPEKEYARLLGDFRSEKTSQISSQF